MNGIPIDIDPTLIYLGGLEIRWFGLAVAAGIIVAVWVGMQEAKRKGLPEDAIETLAVLGVIGGFAGSRLFHVFDNMAYYIAHPLSIFAFQEGGLAIWGGVVGGIVVGAVYVIHRRMPLGKVFDIAAPALLTGQIIGRIGCTINGDDYGSVTSLPWGFIYQHPKALLPPTYMGVPTHPYPVYEMLWNLALFGLIWSLRKRVRTDGLLFTVYVAGYSVGRFFLMFIRDGHVVAYGLQQAQVLALGGLVVTVLLVFYLKVLQPARLASTRDGAQRSSAATDR